MIYIPRPTIALRVLLYYVKSIICEYDEKIFNKIDAVIYPWNYKRQYGLDILLNNIFNIFEKLYKIKNISFIRDIEIYRVIVNFNSMILDRKSNNISIFAKQQKY